MTFFVHRKEKEYYKALETPEEKRARRLAKKVYTSLLTDSMQVHVCLHMLVYMLHASC